MYLCQKCENTVLKRTASKKGEQRVKNRRVSMFTALVLLVLIGYMAYTLAGLYTDVSAAGEAKEALEEDVRNRTEENDLLRYAVDHSDEDEVIADAARDKLGLVFPDETVFTTEDD